MLIDDLEWIGSFAVDSGLAMVGDPGYLDQWKTNQGEKWELEGKVGQYSYQGACATTVNDSAGVLGNGKSVVFKTGSGVFKVYAKFNEEGRLIKVVIDLQLSDSDLESGVVLENLQWIGSFGVDSGQAMVGDPCYLDGWKTDDGEEWELKDKIGQYSYQGASATTIDDSAGVLGNGMSVVFNTGYGDGVYPVYTEVDQNSDGQILKIFIDFSSEE